MLLGPLVRRFHPECQRFSLLELLVLNLFCFRISIGLGLIRIGCGTVLPPGLIKVGLGCCELFTSR